MNNLRINIIYCVAAFLFPTNLYAQSRVGKIDSLKQMVKTARLDSDKVKQLIALSEIFPCADTLNKIRYANKALELSDNLKWEKGVVSANITLGSIYERCFGNYLISVNYYQQAVSSAKKSRDTLIQAVALQSLANIYKTSAQYSKALEYYREVLGLKTGTEDELGVLGNMGIIYNNIGDYPQALASYDSCLKLLQESIRTLKNSDVGDTLQMEGLLVNIGSIYIETSQYGKALGNYEQALDLSRQTKDKSSALFALSGIAKTYKFQDDFVHAIEYYNRALEDCKEIKNKTEETGILDQLANVYLEKGSVSEAMVYAQSALKMAEENNLSEWLPKNYITLGKINTKLKEYNKATAYLEKAVGLCKETGELEIEKDALEALSMAYEQMKQPAKALAAYKDFIVIRDSVYNIDKAKQLTRMEITSDFETKQMADSLRQSKEREGVQLRLQRQKAISIGGIAGVALVLALAFFIYRNYRQQKNANVVIQTEKQRADALRVRAEQSEQFKQQFLANMSHEIRTPMNAVSGMTDLLLDKNPRPDQANYLQVISKSSDILLHIINDILDLSKIEAGKLEMESMDFSLADTIKQVKETLALKSEEKGLQLITDVKGNIPDVLVGDPYRLNQVLINLGGNAIKFTERGSVEIEVKKTAEDNETVSLQFSIIDTGIGIPRDKLNVVFESFTQVNSSDTRRYGGTGLGLSISKQLVELQGGKISVDSEEGRGTIFSFAITFKKGSADRLQERIISEQKVDGSVLDGLRILLADDNEYNRLVACEALHSKAAVHIDEAANGQEAIQLIEQNDYDIVLMDVQMPVMDGLEATRYIRDKLSPPKNGTPVIALTASMLRADLDKCVHAGMNTYVPKPFKAWQLITAIADLTGRKMMPGQAGKDKQPVPVRPTNEGAASNLAYLSKFCEGDEGRMKSYIRLYLKAVPSFNEKMIAAAAEKDMENISALIHTFKPKMLMMGMDSANELGIKIDLLCRENDDSAYAHIGTLLEQTNRSVVELGGWGS